MSFSPIASILNKSLKQKSGLAVQITAALVCEEFEKIVLEKWREQVRNKAKALYLKDRVLAVACLSSVLAQEIKLQEREITRTLNEKFGKDTVERIRYVM